MFPGMQPISFTSLDVMVKEAKRNNCWIYGRENKKWYTPDEFHAEITRVIASHGQLEKRLQLYAIKDPRAGIRDRMAYVKKMVEELERFTESVLTFYEFREKKNG